MKNTVEISTPKMLKTEHSRLIFNACFGAVLGYFTYEIIYWMNPFVPKATSSWMLAFLIGVMRQHALHRYYTFRSTSPYLLSLFRAYLMYSGSLVLGAALNYVLIEILHFHHRIGWIACLLITAAISLFFLKRFVFKPNEMIV